MIKKYETFVSEEYDGFYDDLETSNKNIKLLSKFKSTIGRVEIQSEFDPGKPKAKFKPQMKTFKKTNDKNGIF